MEGKLKFIYFPFIVSVLVIKEEYDRVQMLPMDCILIELS